MAVTKIDVEAFVSLSKVHLIVDVRSEGEYQHAHIPSAISLPLFNNEERKVVGTAYKQQSRKAAIKIGLDYFGSKMRPMVEEVERLVEENKKLHATTTDNIVLVHCWRGGMRSGAVAWLLDLYGFKVYALAGGYKAFRNWVLQQFEVDYNFMILGGYTGSGKTYLLHELQKQGEHIIDLEQLANHKGSSFGNIGLPAQPSQEMFENMLAVELREKVDSCQMKDDIDEDSGLKNYKLQTTNYKPINPSSATRRLSTKRIWLEDESQRIGTVMIPACLWNTIRRQPVYFFDIDFEERLEHIVQEYGPCDKERLIEAINRIQKRLGGLETKAAVNFLLDNNVKESFRVLLKYYDKQYLKALHNRDASAPPVTTVRCKTVDVKNASALLHAIKHIA